MTEPCVQTTTPPKTPCARWLWAAKNWLFAGNDEAAKRLAILYTLLGSCHIAGIADPWAYLRGRRGRFPTGFRFAWRA